MHKLILPPDNSSYSVEDSVEEVLRVQLAGGAGRYRRDILNASKIINCVWVLGREKFSYIEMFYRVMTQRAGEPFEIDLIIGEDGLTSHEARFIPGTFKLIEQKGLSYQVSAQLEAKPLHYDFENEDLFISLLGVYGICEWKRFVNILEHFVNVVLPDNIGPDNV
jgi:hypothetical protein